MYPFTNALLCDVNITFTSMHVTKKLDHCLRILSHINIQSQICLFFTKM